MLAFFLKKKSIYCRAVIKLKDSHGTVSSSILVCFIKGQFSTEFHKTKTNETNYLPCSLTGQPISITINYKKPKPN